MPSVIVLLTTDSALADIWERQLPAGKTVLRLGAHALTGEASSALAAAVVLDAAAEAQLPRALERSPTLFVGEPGSQPFERARLDGRARVFLSYEESARRLREFLPLLEEIAEKQSMLNLLMEKAMRADSARASARPAPPFAAADSAELWDFLDGAIENVEHRERLITEFLRAARQLFRASRVLFFFREADAFRAERGEFLLPADDAIVGFFERHPVIVDGTNWEGAADPAQELAVRKRLALWGARLIVPVHENGRLHGLIAVGVRDDGQPYDEQDRVRAVCFARLLRQFVAKSRYVGRLAAAAEQMALAGKCLPRTLLLGPGEAAPAGVPVAVRDLVGRVARSRKEGRLPPSAGQPFRARAGVIEDTGGVWAAWEEASGEVRDGEALRQAERGGMLRELGLTLGHEFGNALMSLGALRQLPAGEPIPSALAETLRSELSKLEAVSHAVGLMQGLHEAVPASVDLRDVVRAVGAAPGITAKVGPEPVVLPIARGLVEFALRVLVGTVSENRAKDAVDGLTLQVRSSGSGADLTALVSLEGAGMELEGILPEPVPDGVPNLGRLGVLLAKEILRMHGGEIHAGPGIERTEILFSLRALAGKG